MSDSTDSRCRVVLIVPDHSITGEVNLSAVRLSDWLNDARNSFVEIHNAELARLAAPGKVLNQTLRATIPKAQVVIAFEIDPGSVPAPQRLYAYRRKRAYPVFLATGSMEVRGFVHGAPTEGGPDLSAMRPERFIPVTKAVVTISGMESFSIRRDSLMVHIQAIDYFSVGEAVDTGE